MEELNIGHSIVSRAVFVGLTKAVREMKECIDLDSRQNGLGILHDWPKSHQ